MAFSVHSSNGHAQTDVFPATDVEAKAYSRAASDDSADSEDSDSEDSDSEDSDSEDSDSEDSSTPDENSDNSPGKDEADTESDVEYVNTTFNPFRVSNEVNQYCTTLILKKIKQEPVSGSETATESEVDLTERDSVNHPKIISPDHSTHQTNHLKKHKQTHLPAGQRAKVHQCDHEGCYYSTNRAYDLKKHKQTHLPADQRTKVHQCDHEGCYYSTDIQGNLNRHKQTHLPADQRLRSYQCDHEGCHYDTDRVSSLKEHKQTHLAADQRLKRPKRPKRKAYDQPPSNVKRKKDDQD